MKKVVLLGGGNVAYHLAKKLSQSTEYQLIQIYNRSSLSPEFDTIPVEKTSLMEALLPADIYILSVKDQAIAPLSSSLPFKGRLVVHTSGSVPMKDLSDRQRRGVCYPLQSFSKEQEIDFSKIPFCLETEEATDFALLEGLAKEFSPKCYAIDSLQPTTCGTLVSSFALTSRFLLSYSSRYWKKPVARDYNTISSKDKQGLPSVAIEQ